MSKKIQSFIRTKVGKISHKVQKCCKTFLNLQKMVQKNVSQQTESWCAAPLTMQISESGNNIHNPSSFSLSIQ